MNTYVAFLRGINVGGNSLIKMVELKDALAKAGLENVRTYIQSGNVIFDSAVPDTNKLIRLIKDTIQNKFNVTSEVAIFSEADWRIVIESAPKWWGKDQGWKHNVLILIKPFDINETVEAIGKLKPEIEKIEPGHGVIYQSVSIQLFGRTTTGKLAANPIYKRMTIRNFNTATRLKSLLE